MINTHAIHVRVSLGLCAAMLALGATHSMSAHRAQDAASKAPSREEKKPVPVQYLEIVTPKVEETCAALEKLHKIKFSQPEAMLGNARTAALRGGGRIAVRAPLREDEDPVVRPYTLVEDIQVATRTATAAGAEFAMTATEIPGQGTFAIYFLGGIQYGLWQN